VASAPYERRDARESLSRSGSCHSMCAQNMNTSIPVYQADGSLYASVSEQRLARLQSAGLVSRVVRHRKGHINRAILFLRPGEPKPMSVSSVMGTRYSIKELLGPEASWRQPRREYLCTAGDANSLSPGGRGLLGPVNSHRRNIGGRYLARVRGAVVRKVRESVRGIGTSRRLSAAR
jgi:hypothetical protein